MWPSEDTKIRHNLRLKELQSLVGEQVHGNSYSTIITTWHMVDFMGVTWLHGYKGSFAECSQQDSWSHLPACMLSHFSHVNSLPLHGLKPARLLCPWGFSRQEYWSGLPHPPPGDLPDPETEPASPASPVLHADSLPLSHKGSPVTAPILSQTPLCISIQKHSVSQGAKSTKSPISKTWSRTT